VSGLLVKVGTVMTCENGHEIATVRRDIYSQTYVMPDDFEWNGEVSRPSTSTKIEGCPACGSAYIRVGPLGQSLHTADGWIPDYHG